MPAYFSREVPKVFLCVTFVDQLFQSLLEVSVHIQPIHKRGYLYKFDFSFASHRCRQFRTD